ncbi:hypothetical protein [Sphingomonas aurantiaca]|uniref:hypothetical protein n=1 Tax=Sphingomonas aurantiaca TaxID=185949 RepID=UPI00335327C9
MTDHHDDQQEPRPAFGQWLMTQKDRTDLGGQLAIGAVADRRFPRNGDPEAVRRRGLQIV